MANDYLKIGKIFNLNQSNGTSATTISGASFIYDIINAHTSTITVTVDESYVFVIPANGSVHFGVPVGFSTVKINTSASHAAQIIYS
jgi:hypothetical protein